MKCREFERLWNDLLDAREGGPAELERELEAHAASCDPCRAIAVRFQTLRHVLRASGPPPAPPADFADRFFEDPARLRIEAPRSIRLRATWVTLAAAASLLVVATVAVSRSGLRRDRAAGPPVVQEVKAIDPASLTQALTLAGSATWDLARETSAPAARVGREVLDSASIGSATLPLPVPDDPTADVLQRVGDRVNAGVRPLSGTARHAFGFLLGATAATPPT